MVRHLAIAWMVYAALVLQPGASGDIAIRCFCPWIPGIVVVACALVFEGPASLIWAAILGLGVDCLSVNRPGIHLVLATLTVSGIAALRSDHRSAGVISVGVLVFGASFVWRMAASVVNALLDRHPFDIANLASSASGDGGGTALIAIAGMVGWRLTISAFRSQNLSSISLNNRWSMLTEKS